MCEERAKKQVSIHATLAGGDHVGGAASNVGVMFLSTPPSRVATFKPSTLLCELFVSIHATLAGGDLANVDGLLCVVSVSIHATLAGGDQSAESSPTD